jgi:hypothetical protein
MVVSARRGPRPSEGGVCGFVSFGRAKLLLSRMFVGVVCFFRLGRSLALPRGEFPGPPSTSAVKMPRFVFAEW